MFAKVLAQNQKRGQRALALAGIVLLGYGALMSEFDLRLLAYVCLLVASLLPAFLWLRAGAHGIPILPAFALAHIPYYAFPVLRFDWLLDTYDVDEMLDAALTVSLFLVTASIAAHVGRTRALRQEPLDLEKSALQLNFLVVAGLVTGLVFQVGSSGGWLFWFESFYGTLRAIAMTFALVACYCYGLGVGQRLLTRRNVALGGALAAANVLMSWSSLFLVGGMIFILAGTMGYVIATGRVPWKSFLIVFAIVSVLQAGKREMRDEYWYQSANYGGSTDISSLPERLIQWGSRGIEVIGSPAKDAGERDVTKQGVLDRTSLLQIMLLAQRLSPDAVEFLGGATYALLPQILLPRFILPDKPTSQEGMNMLNIHYGLLQEHEVLKTAVGWGLVSESYANFGYLGVIGMGLLVGAFCRLLTLKSARHPGISLASLIAIAALVKMINMEADFIGLSLSLLQAFVAVLVFHKALVIMTRRAARRKLPRGAQAGLAANK